MKNLYEELKYIKLFVLDLKVFLIMVGYIWIINLKALEDLISMMDNGLSYSKKIILEYLFYLDQIQK